VNFVGYEVTKK